MVRVRVRTRDEFWEGVAWYRGKGRVRVHLARICSSLPHLMEIWRYCRVWGVPVFVPCLHTCPQLVPVCHMVTTLQSQRSHTIEIRIIIIL